MKTNVNMVRKMGEFEVTQRTKDGMFNATGLLNQWNAVNKSDKRINDFLDKASTKEFIEVLNSDAEIAASKENQILTSIRGGNIQGTWMHPYLFIDFAMWINPKFKLDVIRFVYDQLIQFRHSVGDNYKGLTGALTAFENVNYPQIAKGLNYIVFGKHEPELRQHASEDQLKELNDLQKKLAFAIDMGYIRSFEQLLNEMRLIWYKKQLFK